jgi:hypothetical protein
MVRLLPYLDDSSQSEAATKILQNITRLADEAAHFMQICLEWDRVSKP